MLTPDQRERRRRCIGSSEIAAIFGLDPWLNAEDLRLVKCGLVADFAGNNASKIIRPNSVMSRFHIMQVLFSSEFAPKEKNNSFFTCLRSICDIS